jgi:alpha-1,6-mannosyltransferase
MNIVKVHFSSYPLQTGASLFSFLHDASFPVGTNTQRNTTMSASATTTQPTGIWTYSKAEDPTLATPNGARSASIDFVVLESGTEAGWVGDAAGWSIITEIQGLKGVKRGGKYGVRVEWDSRVVILGDTRSSGQP